MDDLNDYDTVLRNVRAGARTGAKPAEGPSATPALRRHYLRNWTGAQAPLRLVADGLACTAQLRSGKAVTLRARELSVLRIAQGRVWATLTDAGDYSRVQAGDHFLNGGDSLTLLPGQEVVMESFTPGHQASAWFSWESAEVASSCVEAGHDAAPANWQADVLTPLGDLRHAMGQAASAAGRLGRGLGHAGSAAALSVLNSVAILFIAAPARNHWAEGRFDTETHDSAGPCRL